MVKITAMEKASILVKNEQIFKMCETSKYEYYLVKGKEHDTYDVIFHKDKDVYTCTCKNIRIKPCSHKLGVMISKGEIIEKNGKSYKRNSLESSV